MENHKPFARENMKQMRQDQRGRQMRREMSMKRRSLSRENTFNNNRRVHFEPMEKNESQVRSQPTNNLTYAKKGKN